MRCSIFQLVAMLGVICFGGELLLASETEAEAELGSYEVGFRNLPIQRDDGSSYTAWVFYPAQRTEQDAPMLDVEEAYPAVSFGHGFLQPVHRYKQTLRFLASHGYLVIATNSHRGISPNHAQYSRDMAQGLSHLIELGRDESSWLAGRVDEQSFALSGHSMGGGAAVKAAGIIEVQALIPLAGAPLRLDSADREPERNGTAQLHIVGGEDRIVPPGASRPMFQRGVGDRIFAVIEGGSHCGFMDETILGCDKGSMDHQEQLRITRSLMLGFLDLYLKGDADMHERVWVEDEHEGAGLVSFERLPRGNAGDQ